MSVTPKSVLFCFVFAFVLSATAVAQPPAPMPQEYLEDDQPLGIATVPQNDTGWVDEPALTVMPRWMGMPWMYSGPQEPIFSETELGAHPHLGENGSPGVGYPHRDLPPAFYGPWYRPNGYEGTSIWTRPYSFNPRGYGVPQHRSAYKLDYAPATLSTTATQYGPYYYPRFRDLHDPHRDLCEKDCCHSDTCRKRSFWLLDR